MRSAIYVLRMSDLERPARNQKSIVTYLTNFLNVNKEFDLNGVIDLHEITILGKSPPIPGVKLIRNLRPDGRAMFTKATYFFRNILSLSFSPTHFH